MNNKELLQQWCTRARLNQHAHFECYKNINFWNKFLSTTILVLNTALGSSALFLLSFENNTDLSGLVLSMGIIGILIAVFSILHTFFKLGEVAEKHRTSGVRYGQVRREIEALLCNDDVRELSHVKEKLDFLSTESPVVSTILFNKTKKKLSCNTNT